MQAQRPTTNLTNIITALSHNLIVQLLSFFDRDTLANINQIIPYCKNLSETEKFFKMVRIFYFTANFLNRTDRSLYYPFYDNTQFKKFQLMHLSNVTEDTFPKFQQVYSHFCIVFNTMRKIYPGQQQMHTQFQTSLLDPQLPLPKLRRENVGMFCKSSFQFFLTDIKYGMQAQTEFYGISQILKEEFEGNIDNFYKNLWQYSNKNKETVRKIHEIRFTPQIINIKNVRNYFISNNNLHNLIVWMFCAAEVLVEASYIYLSSIQDPIYRLVQFNLRYNIYKNFVLEIEDKFPYVFQTYGHIYEDLFESASTKPKFTFWRASMTKWANHMNKLHNSLENTYLYCLTKLRINNLCDFLSNNSEQNSFQYTSILNKLHKNEFLLQETEKLYHENQQNAVEQYFQENKDLYELVTVQYLQHIIDLSINEHTVHYCGHSQHALQEPYLQFQKQILTYNQRFYHYLEKIVQQSRQGGKMLTQIFKNQIDFLDICLVKPVTLVKIIKQANQSIERISKEISFEPYISGNFEQRNSILKYFNSRAQILQSITTYPQKYFYAIWPCCSPNDKLIGCQIQTKNTDPRIQEYFSDEEISQKMDIEQS